MRVVSIAGLPAPPAHKLGWPWNEPYRENQTGAEKNPIHTAERDMAWPRITIVTPSFNQGRFIEETIRSVLLQRYPNIEYFIMDGGSTDGTVEVIRKYESLISGWISVPDCGQSDAIGKGFDKATGSCLGWINSDDLFMPEALFNIAARFKLTPNAIIAGNVLNRNMSSGREELIQQQNISLEALLRPWKRSAHFHQPGLFFPREAYQKVGGIDRNLRFTMDYDLLCRLLHINTPVVYTEPVVACFRLHDSSKTIIENTSMMVDTYRTASRYWPLLEKPIRFKKIHMLIHFMLRSAKWMIRGKWEVAAQSIKGGIQLCIKGLGTSDV